jgi:SSS family solute:Na+ symporter
MSWQGQTSHPGREVGGLVAGLDIIVLALYMVGMLVIGWIGSRVSGSAAEYMVAGRNMPLWMYAPIMAALVLGGGSTLGSARLGVEVGISGAWLAGMIGSGIVVLGFLLSSKISQLRAFTVSEFLGQRFGPSVRYLSAVVMGIYCLMITVLQQIAIGNILSSLTGWPVVTCILVGGLVVVLYTGMGGMWSVSMTDLIQWLIMTVGIFFIALPVGLGKVGGWAGLQSALPASSFDWTAIGWSRIFSFFLLYFFGMMIGQDIWQRVFTAKTPKTASWGCVLAGLYSIGYAIALAVVGMVAAVLMPGIGATDQVFPEMIRTLIPPGLSGLVLAAVVSAVMSTADANMLGAATLVVNDLYGPSSKTPKTEAQKLRLIKIATVATGLVSIIFAIWIQDVLVALDLSYAILSGGLFIPLIAGFFWPRATGRAAMISIIASCLVIIGTMAVEGLASQNAIIYGMGGFPTWVNPPFHSLCYVYTIRITK